ncbi:Vacuolar protein sorting-associated protein 16 isoform 2 [Schistosoma japonicum]|uniref:Vacuolar protein sorting-associated protein 16 homolog n=2 Tax=Schistosoma japonicum TaxID=6182 RepID=A0A4Z2DY55_SCHJA|nr:Vacuolar protein sorting-associated protein 16 isoform 2 [Schistosoma japonicum]
MTVLGEDWFAVGDIYFRKLHLYDMPWGMGFPISQFQISVCQYSGYIAMYLDGQSGSKPILQIYTSSGRLVHQHVWKDAPGILLGWTLSEDLLVVQKTGFTTVLDHQGKFVRRFSMGPEAEEREIISARLFTMDYNTGIAVLTGGNHIYVTTSIETPRMRRLVELPGPVKSLSQWIIVTTPLETGSPDSFRSPWVLFADKKNLYRADFGTLENIELSKLIKSTGVNISLLSISLNMQFVAIYLSNGELLIANTRFTELHSHINLTQRISVMLMSNSNNNNINNNNNTNNSSSNQKLNHPKTMLWLTNSAVTVQWNNLVAIISTQSDIYETFYADDIYLAQEVDGIRIISPTSHELLQRVPSPLEALGRIGASCPATWLLSASKSLKANCGRTNDYLLPIKQTNQMIDAVSHCIEAACHATVDPICQQELLESAHLGRILLSAMSSTTPTTTNVTNVNSIDNYSVEVKVKELADHAAKVCQTLRLLNNLAVPWLGIALTWRQFRELGPNKLFERLLARCHYPIAIELVRIHQKYKWPISILEESQSNYGTCTFTRLLAHWACNSSVASSGATTLISERVAAIVNKLFSDLSESKSKSGNHNGNYHSTSIPHLDFADVASQAISAGRETVAEQILEYEPRAGRQVPLLLKLSRYNRALVRAVETGNPELITTVVVALQEQSKLPPADLAMVLRRNPIALAIYQETLGQTDHLSSGAENLTQSALLNFHYENDRASEAKKLVFSAYQENSLASRLTLLQNAEEIYRQLKNDFMAQECNAQIRLLKFQSKLEKQELSAPVFEIKSLPGSNRILPEVVQSGSVHERLWVGQSLNTTLSRLLASGQYERQADQLRREFRVSEKRYAFLRIVGMAINNASWLEMDKMIRAKKPTVNVEILFKICIDGNRIDEAIKLIHKLPPERMVRYWLMVGRIEEAIQVAVRERSEHDLLYIQREVGKTNKELYDRITNLRSQIR